MEAGKVPTRVQDRSVVVNTFYDYRDTVGRLMTIFCKELKRDIRMSDFFAFGQMNLIELPLQVDKWITKHIDKPVIR